MYRECLAEANERLRGARAAHYSHQPPLPPPLLRTRKCIAGRIATPFVWPCLEQINRLTAVDANWRHALACSEER